MNAHGKSRNGSNPLRSPGSFACPSIGGGEGGEKKEELQKTNMKWFFLKNRQPSRHRAERSRPFLPFARVSGSDGGSHPPATARAGEPAVLETGGASRFIYRNLS